MQNKKEVLIDKIVKKDYNNELEKIFENKAFSKDAKNLLLSILYKIEISYKDYKKVKVDVEKQEKYIENILNIIQNDCNKIDIVNMNLAEESKLKGRTFIVDKENKEIICLPIERKLLYSIEKIGKRKQIIRDEYYILNRTISNMINIGNAINNVEVLRDFNGWSWNTIKSEIESIEYNLIYNNLSFLVGYKFLNKWLKNEEYIIDYYELFKNKILKVCGEEEKDKIIFILEKLSILLEIKYNKSFIDELIISNNELVSLMAKFSDKEKYIKAIMQEVKSIREKIILIDDIKSNRELLSEKYIEENKKLPLDKKIFSMRLFAEKLNQDRQKLYEKLEEKNRLLNPKEFVNEKNKIESKYRLISSVNEIINDKGNIKKLDLTIQNELLNLQKYILKVFLQDIDKANNKQEIIDLIYRFRYYYFLPLNYEKEIKDIQEKEINENINKCINKLIKKAIENKIIQNISENEDDNYLILKSLLKNKTIDLQKLSIKIVKEKDEYYVEIFEEDSCELREKLENFTAGNIKQLGIKVNKSVEVFV